LGGSRFIVGRKEELDRDDFGLKMGNSFAAFVFPLWCTLGWNWFVWFECRENIPLCHEISQL